MTEPQDPQPVLSETLAAAESALAAAESALAPAAPQPEPAVEQIALDDEGVTERRAKRCRIHVVSHGG